MTELELLIDLHGQHDRQGPGSDDATRRAVRIAGLDRLGPLKIADIGCGTGASTLCLLDELDAHVTAADNAEPFIERLRARLDESGAADRVTPVVANMAALPFDDEYFDAVWSEGAIYNIGFAEGLREWRRFLKPGGVIAVTDIAWTTRDRSDEIESYWEAAGVSVATLTEGLDALERAGFEPLGAFVLPRDCWEDAYYRPLESGFDAFLERHGGADDAAQLIGAHREEIAMYRAFGTSYSYAFYIGRRPGPAPLA